MPSTDFGSDNEKLSPLHDSITKTKDAATKQGVNSRGESEIIEVPIIQRREATVQRWLSEIWLGSIGAEVALPEGVFDWFDSLYPEYEIDLGKQTMESFIEGQSNDTNSSLASPAGHTVTGGSGGGIPGTPSEIALRVRAALQRFLMEGEFRMIPVFFERELAVTAARLIDEGKQAETVADLILLPLLQLPIRTTPKLLQLAGALYRFLVTDPITPGVLATIGGIGDLLGSASEKSSWMASAHLYVRLLGQIHAFARPPYGPEMLRPLDSLANNLCGRISQLAAQEDSVDLRPVLNRIHRVSVMAAANSKIAEIGHLRDELVQIAWDSLGGRGNELGTKHAIILAGMAHMPLSWRWEAIHDVGEHIGHQRLIIMETMAAAVRIALGVDDDEISQTLFNAGISLIRLRKTSGAFVDEGERIAVNAAGLMWALRDVESADHASKVMRGQHGYSCLVNLLGALADGAPNIPTIKPNRPLIAALAEAFWDLEQRSEDLLDGPTAEMDFVRMRGSLAQLGIEVPGRSQAIPTGAHRREALLNLTKEVAPWCVEEIAALTTRDVGEAARAASKLAATVMARISDSAEPLIDWLVTLLIELARRSEHLDKELAELVSWAEDESPIVRAKLCTVKEWNDVGSTLFQSAIDDARADFRELMQELHWDFLRLPGL